MRNFIQEPPGLTAGEGGSTRHPDSFSPCQGWFQSVTPRGSGRSCLSSPWHLSLFRLPLASSPPFPWSLVGTLCAPLLSPHPSDVSLFGLSRSEMSLELFCSKDSCEDLTSHSEAHILSKRKCVGKKRKKKVQGVSRNNRPSSDQKGGTYNKSAGVEKLGMVSSKVLERFPSFCRR